MFNDFGTELVLKCKLSQSISIGLTRNEINTFFDDNNNYFNINID